MSRLLESTRGGRAARDRLAVVLRLRCLEEDRARITLAAALARETVVRDRLETLRSEHAAACTAAAALFGEGVPAGTLIEASAAVEVLERRVAAAARDLDAAAQAMAEARSALALASRRREAVERLRRRRLSEARRLAERRTERELTEIALVRHVWALAERER